MSLLSGIIFGVISIQAIFENNLNNHKYYWILPMFIINNLHFLEYVLKGLLIGIYIYIYIYMYFIKGKIYIK